MNDIKDIFFDLDHTLWDFDKNSDLTFFKILDLNSVKSRLKNSLTIFFF